MSELKIGGRLMNLSWRIDSSVVNFVIDFPIKIDSSVGNFIIDFPI